MFPSSLLKNTIIEIKLKYYDQQQYKGWKDNMTIEEIIPMLLITTHTSVPNLQTSRT